MAKDMVDIQVGNSPGTKNGSSVGSGCDGDVKIYVGSTSNVRKGRRVRTRTKGKGGGTNNCERGSNGSNYGGVGGNKGGSTSSTKVVGSLSSFHNKRNDQIGTGGSAKSSPQHILSSAKDGSGSARQKQRPHMERSKKCDEDVLIQFGTLLTKGDPRALIAQANFQQSSDHDTFIMNVRSIVESSDSGDRGSNKVAKEGISIGRGGGVISLQSSRRNQRKGGSNEAVSGTAPPSTIAKCNRVEPTASPMASGSGLQGDSAAGHIPSPSLRIGRKQEQNSDGQQEADEPLEWISSCSSLDQLKLDFLPLPNPPSISLDDRSTANHSLLPPHVRNQNMLHQLGGAAPSSSPDYNATVNAVNSISHGPMIGKNDSLDDMIVSSFGLSFLSPEQMPISQESELRTQEEVQVLKQQHHHEKKWTGQATWQESVCQQHKHPQCNDTTPPFVSTANGYPDQHQRPALRMPQEYWLHGGVKSAESRNEPSPLLASNWQQAQQNHEQQQQQQQHRLQCELPRLEPLHGHMQSGDSWNEPSTPSASFRQAYQDEGDGSTAMPCRSSGSTSQWEDSENRHWNQQPPPQQQLGPTTASSIQDGGGFTTAALLRGMSNFEHTASMGAATSLLPQYQSSTGHNQLKLPLQQPENETLQSLSLPNVVDVNTIWTAESSQLKSSAAQKSQHPYPVHQPPMLQQSLQQQQYHHHGVPSGYDSVAVRSVLHLSSGSPQMCNTDITTTDATAAGHPPPPVLPSMNAHLHSKYNVLQQQQQEFYPNHVAGSVPCSSQSLPQRNSEVPTSDMSSEGAHLLQMLQAQGGGNEGQSVELMYTSASERGGENCPSQGQQQASTAEISFAKEVIKTFPSPHGTPKQPALPPHKKHGVNDPPNSPLVIQPSIQSDHSLPVLRNDEQQKQQQQHGDKMSSPTGEKEKDRKGDAPQKSQQLHLRSPSKQIGKISLQVFDNATSSSRQPNGVYVRPKSSFPVQWEMPADMFDFFSVGGKGKITDIIGTRGSDGGINASQNLMVGIYRLGVASNASSVISKPLLGKDECHNVNLERGTVSGSVFFHAPKTSGMFVFRIYDENDPYDTLVTSMPWGVAAQGRDIEMNFRILQSQLRQSAAIDGKGAMKALYQLSFNLRNMTDMPVQRFAKAMAGTMWQAVEAAWDQLNFSTADDLDGGGGNGCNSKTTTSEGPRIWAMHVAVRDVLFSVINNPVCRRLLSIYGPGPQPDLSKVDPVASAALPLEIMLGWQQLWCVLNAKFYPSKAALASHYMNDIGYEPNTVPLRSLSVNMLDALTEQMTTTIQKLLPSNDFYITRECLRERLEDLIIKNVPLVPEGSILQVFGSSANGFAMADVDFDMVIMYPSSSVAAGSPREVVEVLAEVLSAEGLQDVDSRPTARIPIVLFKDPETGIECDVSVMNPLAVRNSNLLKTYASIDSRVRFLGFILKYWARRRNVNNATQGTLCSYGYLLCLIYFLQTRVPPVLPNLQSLPADWKCLKPGGGFCSDGGSGQDKQLPQVTTRHPFHDRDCNTYFFKPMDDLQKNSLRNFAARNKESPGQLLASFFRHFAFEHDFRQSIISIQCGGYLSKELKAETDCWPLHNRLSIEDPFETWYDVAHVLRWSRHRHIHMEFIRAYTLLANYSSDDMGGILEVLCKPAPSPFKNTSMDDVDDVNDEDSESLRDGGVGGGGRGSGDNN